MPRRDEYGNEIYSQGEYEHKRMMEEPFSGFVEGMGYVLSEVVVTPYTINKSGTHFMWGIHRIEYLCELEEADYSGEIKENEDYPCTSIGEPVGKIAKGFHYGLTRRYQVASGKWLQGAPVTGLIDTYAGRVKNGKAVGDWAIRVDKIHKGAQSPHPHININPKLSGIPDPHTNISMRTLKTLEKSGKVLNTVGKVARPIAIVTDGIMIKSAIDQDGGRVGKQTVITTSEVVGGWGGAIIGAELGATGGAAIGSIVPGAGTAVGGFIGAIVGGILGSFGVSWFAKESSTYIYEKLE